MFIGPKPFQRFDKARRYNRVTGMVDSAAAAVQHVSKVQIIAVLVRLVGRVSRRNRGQRQTSVQFKRGAGLCPGNAASVYAGVCQQAGKRTRHDEVSFGIRLRLREQGL